MNQRKRQDVREGGSARAHAVDRLEKLVAPRSAGKDGEPSPDSAERRIELLEQRIQHLESMLEGLQDAVDRRAVMQDEQMSELRRRTEPAEIARALSDNARKRGI